VNKWGASFTSHDGSAAQYADFARAVETPTPQTYQVPRERFDDVLLRHAQRSGAEVLQGTRALDAIFDAKGATINYIDPKGLAHTVSVGAVVDASGRAGFLAKRFGKRVVDPVLRNVAVHAQFEGVPRARGGARATSRWSRARIAAGSGSFPSPDGHERGRGHPQGRARDRRPPTAEESLQHYIDETPAAADLMREARRVSPGRFDADYSYLHSQHAGDRWVLVGDAGRVPRSRSSRRACCSRCSRDGGGGADQRRPQGRQPVAGAVRGLRAHLSKRYHHFRRFAVGFYDPAFRDLFFTRRPASASTRPSFPCSPATGGPRWAHGSGSPCSSASSRCSACSRSRPLAQRGRLFGTTCPRPSPSRHSEAER
jgi:hypothetical protein